jgi:hypothetical protein
MNDLHHTKGILAFSPQLFAFWSLFGLFPAAFFVAFSGERATVKKVQKKLRKRLTLGGKTAKNAFRQCRIRL